MDGIARAWRPTAGMRAGGVTVSIGAGVVACVVVWQAFTEPGGLALLPVGLLSAGVGVLFLRYVLRSRVVLTADTLIVVNAFRTHVIPLEEVTDVSASPSGLRITRTGQPALTAGAVQKSRSAVITGEQMTRSDDIASDILVARSHRVAKLSAPPAL